MPWRSVVMVKDAPISLSTWAKPAADEGWVDECRADQIEPALLYRTRVSQPS
jgi:hypothetical protein